MANQYKKWIFKFSEIQSYSERTKKLIAWIKDIYCAEKAIVFFHDSGYLRYSLSRYEGLPRSMLGGIEFHKQPFIRIQNKHRLPGKRNKAVSLEKWNCFSRELSKELAMSGFDTILPLWSGNQCVGGVIFNMGICANNSDIREFESITADIAYQMEIAYVRNLYKRQSWENNVLLEVSKKISSFSDLQDVLDHIIDSLRDIIPYNAAGIFLVDDYNKSIAQKTVRGYSEKMFKQVELKVGKGIVGWSIQHNKEAMVPDVLKDNRYISAKDSTRSEMVVPIVYNDKTMGAFNVESDKLYFFRYHHLDLLRAFAAQTAIVLNNSKMLHNALEVKQLEKELQIAKGIQKALLPYGVPEIRGFEFAAENFSSRMIGGDLYDFIRLSDTETGIAIGDVSGKGIPGAMLMAALSSSLRDRAQASLEPNEVVAKINKTLFHQTESDKYATFFYGILDSNKNELKFTNAGHNPPILIRSGGEFVELSEGGSVLGFIENIPYTARTVTMKKNDVILFYTDGLTEAEDRNEYQYGDERVKDCLLRNKHKSAIEIIRSLLKDVVKFTGNDHHDDDLTMVVIKKDN